MSGNYGSLNIARLIPAIVYLEKCLFRNKGASCNKKKHGFKRRNQEKTMERSLSNRMIQNQFQVHLYLGIPLPSENFQWSTTTESKFVQK